MKKVLEINPSVSSDSINSDLLLIDKDQITQERNSEIVIY